MMSADSKKAFAAHRAADLLAQVKAGVAAVRSSEDWTRWLKQGASFYHYSFFNTVLITLGRPGATHVRGFQAWKALGRTVRKGEQGIPILAPIFRKEETSTPNGETQTQKVRFFKAVFVFDISQTEGADLVELAKPIEGEAPQLLAQLVTTAQAMGYTVDFVELEGSLGGYLQRGQLITLNSRNGSAQQVHTLIHELAHGVLGHIDAKLSRERKELEAETTAWVIAKELGIDSEARSFEYLAGWSAETPDHGAQLEAAAEAAFRAVRSIMNRINTTASQRVSMETGGKA